MESGVTFAVKWIVPSQYGQEKKILNEVAAIIEWLDPLAACIEDIQTTVAEACLNAFEHGNRLNENLMVWVRMTIDDMSYRFHISDEGEGVAADNRLLELLQEHESYRGWGIKLIEALSDGWKYGFSEGRFFVEIEFNRRS